MSRNATAPRASTPSFTLDLPLVTTTIRTPEFAVPAVKTAQQHFPSRKNLPFYGGLAGTAALGLIPWSVAVAVGIGTAIAQR